MADNPPIKIVFSPEAIQRRVRELAEQITTDFAGQEPIMLGVLKGCFIFLSDLVRQVDFPLEVDFVRLASYGSSTTSSGRVHLIKAPELPIKGRPVVVVEDIIDTGVTLKWLREYLESMEPSTVRLCVLVDKAERREVEVEVEYVGFKVPDGFLVGYGLDFDEQYRFLPGIYELTQHEDGQ
ncbi:MAG: hypoxanthine phosphoribosyltransferase [Deltaproteobacteria bacterium]|nr:hypoxanthine phosphoribosyltransferase [Deltaproteobacteria bacterium]